MARSDPRKMALQIAGLRANETHLPQDERVFEDPYAELFFAPKVRRMFQDTARVKSELAGYEKLMPGVNGAIVARIRFFDQCLVDAIAEGLRQLVIIGAGYDTRAYRIEEVERKLSVFEVDHPDTQKVKTDTIRGIFGNLPGHVVYVPAAFGVDPFDRKLAESGYDPQAKTLFIVEGLLMYIPPPAVDGLLAFIVNSSGPGTRLLADFFSASVIDGACPLPEARALRDFVAKEGSALRFGIPEGEEEAFFAKRGFKTVALLSAPSCKDRFFKGKSLNRTVSTMFNFVQAEVAP